MIQCVDQINSKSLSKNYVFDSFLILGTNIFNKLYHTELFHPMWLVKSKFSNFIYFCLDLVDGKCFNLQSEP